MKAVHGALFLSLMLNLALLGAMLNTYMDNLYFQLWINAAIGPITGMISALSAGLSLFAALAFIAEKLKSKVSVTAKVQHQLLKPLEQLALENPNLETR